MQLKPISLFNTREGHLTLSGKTLAVEVMGAPIGQFEFGTKSLLFLPDDPYSGQFLYVLLLDGQCRILEQHSMPIAGDPSQAWAAHIDVRTANTLQIDAGPGKQWTMEVVDQPRLRPWEAIARMKDGWLPLFEWPFLLRGAYLSASRNKTR